MNGEERILRHPGLRPLWESIGKDHRWQQLVAVGVLLGGLAVVTFTLATGFLWPFVGAFVATAGLYWLFRLLSEQPVAAWQQFLREEPQSIAWVYGLVTERMPFGLNLLRSATLYLVETNGETHDFGLKSKDLKLVTKTLNRVLPHAEFGYTEERELKYRGELTRFRGWKNK